MLSHEVISWNQFAQESPNFAEKIEYTEFLKNSLCKKIREMN